jgi:hypothetical protein
VHAVSLCPLNLKISVKDSQCVLEMLINFHDGRLVTTTVAVVWCCESH